MAWWKRSIVNAADGWPVLDGAVWSARLVVLEPVWQATYVGRTPSCLARTRWKIELDYKQLKGELGLDHNEGRSYLGWYHHTALVTAAHGFLTRSAAEPKSPAAGLTLSQTVQLLRPLFKCWTGRCQTCQQPLDLDQIPLHPTRQDE